MQTFENGFVKWFLKTIHYSLHLNYKMRICELDNVMSTHFMYSNYRCVHRCEVFICYLTSPTTGLEWIIQHFRRIHGSVWKGIVLTTLTLYANIFNRSLESVIAYGNTLLTSFRHTHAWAPRLAYKYQSRVFNWTNPCIMWCNRARAVSSDIQKSHDYQSLDIHNYIIINLTVNDCWSLTWQCAKPMKMQLLL